MCPLPEWSSANPSWYFYTQNDYTLDSIPIDIGEAITIGKAIRMDGPSSPSPRNRQLMVQKKDAPYAVRFLGTDKAADETLPDKPVIKVDFTEARKIESQSYFEEESDERLALALRASLGVSGGFGDVQAAMSYVKETRKSGKLIVFTSVCRIAKGDDLADVLIDSTLNGELDDINSLDSSDIILDRFVNQFGSHFVSSITYGYSIGISGSIKTEDSSLKASFSAAFKNFSVKASASGEVESVLSRSEVVINACITSGNESTPVFLSGFAQVKAFIDGLNSGARTLYACPVGMRLQSVRPFLDPKKWPNIYGMLLPAKGERAASPFGVPSGTVVAWHPPLPDQLGMKSLSDLVPAGWRLCDGNNNAPNLTDRFIRGGFTPNTIGQVDGADRHRHSGRTSGPEGAQNPTDRGGNFASMGTDHVHTLSTDEQSNLPPYMILAYIIKD